VGEGKSDETEHQCRDRRQPQREPERLPQWRGET
jgi:hypothetical protein